MPRDDSAYVQDWLRIAEKDWARVARLLQDDDPEAAGFYLQQAIEKFLKAFLVSKGWSLKKVHDLEVLLNDALPHDPCLEDFRTLCQRITGLYFLDRYPISVQANISEQDIAEAVSEAEPLIARLRSQIT